MVSSGDLRAPQFNGQNYEYWAVKMKTILIAYDLWDVVECCDTLTRVSNESDSGEASGSKDKKTESVVTATETKEKRIKDAKALSIIQGALTDDIFPRIRNEETARGAWNLLRREYRGDEKVREVKLQAVRAEFEYMRMSEGESLDHYLTKFFGVINDMKSLGEEITEARIVQKILMSLCRKYKSIVSIIEETRDLKTLRSEEVIASIKVYDRREDLYDERENQFGTERAFSTLRIGSNHLHGGNKGSHTKSKQSWQGQDRRHTSWSPGGNVHNNHSTSWNHRAGINNNNSYNTQNRQGSSSQGIMKPQCQVCHKYHFGICRYKGKAKCGDCNDYKQLANYAQEEEVSIANLFYACHATSIKNKDETNEDHAEQQIEVMHDGVVEEQTFEGTSNLRTELSKEAVKSISEVHAELEDTEIKVKHTEVAVTDLVAGENQNKKTIDATEVMHDELKNEELAMQGSVMHLKNQICGTTSGNDGRTETANAKEEEFLSQIQNLQKELSFLSSCSLAKEKENLRKDLEKTKVKLKETESKLKNAVQEKTKLEGQKAFAEREVKRLHGQKTLLERDISKRDSLAGRRRDSMVDRSSKMFDSKKSKMFEQTVQEDYRNLEVLAFEMEATIASLEEEVTAAHKEKEEAISRNESLASELEALTEKLNISNAEVNVLHEDASRLRLMLEESTLNQQKMESSLRLLAEQKEELAMQLSDSLLEMEEEKAIWFSKEKASIEVIEENTKLQGAEITAFTKAMSEVRNELESCREECKALTEKLACSEENAEREKKSSAKKSLEIDQLKNHLIRADIESKQSQEMLKSNLDTLSMELDCARGKLNTLEKEMNILSKERDDLLTQIGGLDKRLEPENDFQNLQNQLLSITSERDKWMRHCDEMLLESKVRVEELNGRLSSMEAKMKNDEAMNNKERAKFRMRLRGTQAKSDAFHFRYKEAVNELAFMNRNFEVASKKLKNQLASYGIEILNLKKQIAAFHGQIDH